LPIARLRRAQLQKIARHRRGDASFPWRRWARATVNETLAIPSGVHIIDGARQTWAAANAATALCFGKNAAFEAVSQVPQHILAEVEAGAAEALAVGAHLLTDGASLGRAVGLTHELREELKTWLIWPAGATRDGLTARAADRAAERWAKDRERKQKQRRDSGMIDRTEYEANSIAAQARVLGIKPDTLRARLRRAAGAVTPDVASDNAGATTPVTPHVVGLSSCNIDKKGCADTLATDRYSISQKARELGISPGALRVRLHRERQRQAALERAVPVTLTTRSLETPSAPTALPTNLVIDAVAPLKARPADTCADISDIYAYAEPLFDDLPPMGEAPEPIPTALADVLDGPVPYDERIPFTPPGDDSPAPSTEMRAHPVVIQDEYSDREPMPPPRGARPRPPLPPHPDMPAAVPGRNLLEALGVELGALVIRRAHESVPRMLAARDSRASVSDNLLRSISVWEFEHRNLRRELIQRGASFRDCIIAMHGMAAITERETRDASPYSWPIPRPPETGAGLAA
jgi:hypothetical protein